jgi:hypothetical protein
MNRLDIMVDLETLGKSVDTPIIQLCAMAFELETGDVVDVYEVKVQLESKTVIDLNTLRWWLQTDKELLTTLLTDTVRRVSEREALLGFKSWIYGLRLTYGVDESQTYLWGNGILFDNKIIQGKMEHYDLCYPIFYRNDRDVRTLLDLYCAKNNVDPRAVAKTMYEGLKEHNAFDDCVAQIRLVTHCYGDLIDKPIRIS